jgi:RimJ/RimL family protein N-acetyltransferase
MQIRRNMMFARTDRLLLRPIWPEDASALDQAIADEAIVRSFARAPWLCAGQDADRIARAKASPMFPNFIVMRRTDGAPQLIGSCGLGERDGGVELGYWIARPFWGQGYAAEAAKAVVGIARALGHQKLVARHFTDNPASRRVLRKVGFQAVGQCEQRYSAGRGRDATSALFELPLFGDSKDGGDTEVPVSINRMRATTPMMKAA